MSTSMSSSVAYGGSTSIASSAGPLPLARRFASLARAARFAFDARLLRRAELLLASLVWKLDWDVASESEDWSDSSDVEDPDVASEADDPPSSSSPSSSSASSPRLRTMGEAAPARGEGLGIAGEAFIPPQTDRGVEPSGVDAGGEEGG